MYPDLVSIPSYRTAYNKTLDNSLKSDMLYPLKLSLDLLRLFICDVEVVIVKRTFLYKVVKKMID